jgi:hypothetical protein
MAAGKDSQFVRSGNPFGPNETRLCSRAYQAQEEEDVIALETILARCDRVGTNCLNLSELRVLVQQAQSKLAILQLWIAGRGDRLVGDSFAGAVRSKASFAGCSP